MSRPSHSERVPSSRQAVARAEIERRKRAPKLALKSRAEAVKKERVAREKEQAARNMKASKAAYNAKMKIKQDKFKLDQKIKTKFTDKGKVARI